MTIEKDKTDFEKTCSLIPDGVQTLSKMPSKHIQDIYPIYIDRAEGCFVVGGGKRYIDYPCGLGAILLGYAHPATIQAVSNQLLKGNLFSLPHRLETKLAEKINEIIPCAEMVRFVKTGSEAASAAVKIARAYTGRDGVICCGYHGWHDWYSVNTPKNAGIPRVYNSLTAMAQYNDLESFRKYFTLCGKITRPIAAVILEPYIYDEPENGFLKQLVNVAHDNGALVIFDEIITGFRTKQYSAQSHFGVVPDLACFGKAAGNGVPMAWVCGRKEIMKVLEKDCFVSSTFGGDLLGIASALATIKVLENENVIDHIWDMGQQLKDHFNKLTEDLPDTGCTGLPPRLLFNFPNEALKSLFWQECLLGGVLFGYATFISYAHKQNHIDKTCEVMTDAMLVVRRNWDEPHLAMKGRPAQETMRLIQTKH